MTKIKPEIRAETMSLKRYAIRRVVGKQRSRQPIIRSGFNLSGHGIKTAMASENVIRANRQTARDRRIFVPDCTHNKQVRQNN